MDLTGLLIIVAIIGFVIAFVQEQMGIRNLSREMCRRDQVDYKKLTLSQKIALHAVVESMGQVRSSRNYWEKH